MTPNIPQEVLALARKHINKVDPDFGSDVDKIVIAAIMEVTERAAGLMKAAAIVRWEYTP